MKFSSVNKYRVFLQVAVWIVILGSCNRAYAQNDNSTIIVEDTIYAKPVTIKTHSPHKATFYSAILPGLGQAYNKKYWKIPILYAGIGGVIYGLDFNTTNYKKYRRAYRDFLIQDPANKSYLEVLPPTISEDQVINGGQYASWFQQALENKKKYYKKYRDLSYVGLALVYVLNLVDASVDAHFKSFDVSNDLSMHVEPTITPVYGGFSGVGVQVRFIF
ncbi:hypothetical protein SAMN06265379_102283 [Saccharicrinis carchari]|uniref:DUF5683 domain-containing protein n=1 Tax=Saccharicrinis carchari TaxID=1168039 RepID=A0A521C0H5_SACCC|nr:DUF5683 domain-containing protein [Saccharicrinis carchari]SMO52966.1 hypothetical protein SAMN06265379_102283 [Saccharicrinis carchari]